MRFDSNESDEVEVNMTPMIDCVFLLLICFLVWPSWQQRQRATRKPFCVLAMNAGAVPC